jgi:polar amino acid transport system substrate-binding protein
MSLAKPSAPRRTPPAIILSVIGLLLLGSPAPAGDLADIKARGKLIMLSFPLVEGAFVTVDVEAMRNLGRKLTEMNDPEHFRGIDVELMKGFAQSLGVKLEIKPEPGGYEALLPALDRRDGDLVSSSLTITPKRLAVADFSTPYFLQWVVAAVRPDSKIATLADLKGKKVVVMQGSSQFERLQGLNLNPKIQLTSFALQNYNAVLEGEAEFTLMDSWAAVGEPVSATYPGLKVAARVGDVGYGVAVRKGSDLKAALDAYFDGLRQSGELEKILARHGQGAAPAK